jgi:hypothetical protein
MAQKVIVELVDDIDGTLIPDGKGETIEFALDGVGYSIDLGPKNAKAFRKLLDHYVSHATRTGGRRRSPVSSVATKRDPKHTRAIREWAQTNGYEVSTRGRIPAEIEQAYAEAM